MAGANTFGSDAYGIDIPIGSIIHMGNTCIPEKYILAATHIIANEIPLIPPLEKGAVAVICNGLVAIPQDRRNVFFQND